jgi:cyclophilin family peptidyl-prolyl cis-trans isomerase
MTSATIATEKGDIEVDLFTTDAPKATQNFIDLANKGFYDDVVFHRVISGFVIQAGDGEFGKKSSLNRSRVGTGGPGYKFEDEPIKGDYIRGALAMANAGPNTNGSQFFIVTAEQCSWLDGRHTVFGRVVSGQDVVDRISAVERDQRDRPVHAVTIDRVELL